MNLEVKQALTEVMERDPVGVERRRRGGKGSGLARMGRWKELGEEAKGGGAVAGEVAEPLAMFVGA